MFRHNDNNELLSSNVLVMIIVLNTSVYSHTRIFSYASTIIRYTVLYKCNVNTYGHDYTHNILEHSKIALTISTESIQLKLNSNIKLVSMKH